MNVVTKCPSCSNDVDAASSRVCPSCGFQLPLDLVPAVAQPVRQVRKVNAWVLMALLIDVTGSTGTFAVGVLLAIKLILASINAKARQTKVFVHTGGDLDYDEQCLPLCNGVTPEEAIAAVGRITYQGGGDAPETHADSVETVLATTPWEPDAKTWRNAFVAFLTADSKPARSGVTPAQLGAALKSRGILTYLVAEDYPFARQLVEAAEGLFFPISNNPDPAQMQQIAAGISQSILINVASTATRPMTVPATGAGAQA